MGAFSKADRTQRLRYCLQSQQLHSEAKVFLKEVLVLVLQPLNMWILELLVSGHFAWGFNRLDRIRIGSLVNKAEWCMMLCPWEFSIDFFCSFLALQSFLPDLFVAFASLPGWRWSTIQMISSIPKSTRMTSLSTVMSSWTSLLQRKCGSWLIAWSAYCRKTSGVVWECNKVVDGNTMSSTVQSRTSCSLGVNSELIQWQENYRHQRDGHLWTCHCWSSLGQIGAVKFQCWPQEKQLHSTSLFGNRVRGCCFTFAKSAPQTHPD